jgi:hypothetical protein
VDGGSLRYYKDQTCTKELGAIDLSLVYRLCVSQIADAPAFSLDLVTHDRIYTICASTYKEMLQWAAAIDVHTRIEGTQSDVLRYVKWSVQASFIYSSTAGSTSLCVFLRGSRCS